MTKRLITIIAAFAFFALMAQPCWGREKSKGKARPANDVIVALKRIVRGGTIRPYNAPNIGVTLKPFYAGFTFHF